MLGLLRPPYKFCIVILAKIHLIMMKQIKWKYDINYIIKQIKILQFNIYTRTQKQRI